MLLGLFFTLFVVARAQNIVWELPEPNTYRCPALLYRSFWGFAETYNYLYYKNWSLVLVPDGGPGCFYDEGYDATGLVLLVAGVGPCSNGASLERLSRTNAAAMIGPIFSDYFALPIDDVFQSWPRNTPFFTCHYYDIYDPTWTMEYDPGPLLGAIMMGNLTMLMMPPVTNQFWDNWTTIGSGTNFSFVINLIAALAALVFASCKLALHTSKFGFHFHIPHIVFLLCIGAAIVGIYLSLVGYRCWRAYSNFLAYLFFSSWSLSLTMTANLLLGLYFYEISFVQRMSVPGLHQLKIPAIIAFVIIWIFIIVTSAITSAPSFWTTELANFINTLLVTFSFIQIGIIVQFLVVTYAAFILLYRIASVSRVSRSNSRGFVLVIVRALISTWLITGFFTFWNCSYQLLIPLVPIDVIHPAYISEYSFILFGEYMQTLLPCACTIILCSCFTVRQEKEIAKSRAEEDYVPGTGSTSNKKSSDPDKNNTTSLSSSAAKQGTDAAIDMDEQFSKSNISL